MRAGRHGCSSLDGLSCQLEKTLASPISLSPSSFVHRCVGCDHMSRMPSYHSDVRWHTPDARPITSQLSQQRPCGRALRFGRRAPLATCYRVLVHDARGGRRYHRQQRHWRESRASNLLGAREFRVTRPRTWLLPSLGSASPTISSDWKLQGFSSACDAPLGLSEPCITSD